MYRWQPGTRQPPSLPTGHSGLVGRRLQTDTQDKYTSLVIWLTPKAGASARDGRSLGGWARTCPCPWLSSPLSSQVEVPYCWWGCPHHLPSHYVLLPEGVCSAACCLEPQSLDCELQERWPGFSLPAGLPSGDLPPLESRWGIPPAKPRFQKNLQALSNQMHLCACARVCLRYLWVYFNFKEICIHRTKNREYIQTRHLFLVLVVEGMKIFFWILLSLQKKT